MLVKDKPIKIRLTGLGGQGIILSGLILGKAAVVYDGIQAIQNQSYGPEMRGTKCKTDLIISYDENPILHPAIDKADILVALSQEAWTAYQSSLHKYSLVFIDSDLVQITHESCKTYRIPASKAADELGDRIVTNIIMLGALIEVTEILSKVALEQALLDSIPSTLRELNLAALKKGYALGKKLVA